MNYKLAFVWVQHRDWETFLSNNEDILKKGICKVLSDFNKKLGSIRLAVEEGEAVVNISENVKDTLVMSDWDSVYVNIDSFNEKLNGYSLEQSVNDIFEFIKDKITKYFSDSMFNQELKTLIRPELILLTDEGDTIDSQCLLDDREEIFHDKNLVSKKDELMMINSLSFCQQILNCDFSNIINEISTSNDTSKKHFILIPLDKDCKVIDKVEFLNMEELSMRHEVDNECHAFILPYEYSPNSITNRFQSVSSLCHAFMHSALFFYAKSRYNRQVDSELSKFMNKYMNDPILLGVSDIRELMDNYVKNSKID